MGNQGWISIHRKIQECFLWVDKEPFDRRSAWIDLLLSANHEDKKVMFDGKPITVNRGDKLTSILALADRWHWSRHKVSNFLNVLESEQMIVQKRDNKKTLITIVNYEVYQTITEVKGQQKDIRRTSEGHQKDTNNNDNNDNKDIIKDIENGYAFGTNVIKAFVIPPPIEWIEKYCKERNNGIDPQKFFDFYESKGWKVGKEKMKNWQACVRTWENRDKKEQKKDPGYQKTQYDFKELEKMIKEG